MKMRQRVVMKPHRGAIVVQKWPKKRGPFVSERQRAWIERFSLWACLVKSPDADSYNRANEWAKGTGWYWRDVLMAAMAGNLIEIVGEKKITTPTAHISRTSTLALSANVNTVVPMSLSTWDNNNFWASSPNPSRIVFKSPGLYTVNLKAQFNNTSTDKRVTLNARLNGVDLFRPVEIQDISNNDVSPDNYILWYFHADEYIEVMALSTVACDLNWAEAAVVAITPEAIIP